MNAFYIARFLGQVCKQIAQNFCAAKVQSLVKLKMGSKKCLTVFSASVCLKKSVAFIFLKMYHQLLR
jgi:hypothetical protein